MAIAVNVIILLLYFLLYLVVRRKWLAHLLTVLMIFFLFFSVLTSSDNPTLTSIGLLLGVGIGIPLVTRFGLVAGCFSTMASVWITSIVTSDLTAWHGLGGLYGVIAIVVLAGYAFYTSLGGQKVFTGKLLEE